MQHCIHHEVSYGGGAHAPPASLLRWDIPAAIFAGGRCVRPVGRERNIYPKPNLNPLNPLERQDDDGWQLDGFVGHGVSRMGVGWVLDDIPQENRGAAFPHDAWTAAYSKSGTWPGADIASCQREPALALSPQPQPSPTGIEYAEARRRAMSTTPPRRSGMSPMQRFASAYKWGVANSSSLNCFHWRWDDAIAKQRAHALLFQSTPGSKMARRVAAAEEMRPECSIWDSLYNQVHVAYNLSNVRAIFYVNDTVTPLRLPKRNHTVAARRRVFRAALRAADAALAYARAAQRLIEREYSVTLPIVQYFFTAECFDPERLATRLALEMARTELRNESIYHQDEREIREARIWGDAAWTAKNIFRAPPEPLLEHFAEFFGGVSKKQAAKDREQRLAVRKMPSEYRWLFPDERKPQLYMPPRVARRQRMWSRLRRHRAREIRQADEARKAAA